MGSILKRFLPGREDDWTKPGWYCNECGAHISEEDGHYHCYECYDYDVCLDCYGKGAHSCSLLTYETIHSHNIIKKLTEISKRTLAEYYHAVMLYFGPRPFLGTVEPSTASVTYSWITYQQMHMLTVRYYLGMHKLLVDTTPGLLGLSSLFYDNTIRSLDGVMLGICSRNCVEWVIADFGNILCGMITVPIHVTFNVEQKKAVLMNSKTTCLIVGGRNESRRSCGCKNCSPFVQGEGYDLLEEFLDIKEHSDDSELVISKIITIEKPCEVAIKRAERLQLELVWFEEMMNVGKELCGSRGISNETLDMRKNIRAAALVSKLVPSKGKSTNPIYTIMYTSGSTGEPKGVVISKDFWLNFMGNVHTSHAPLVSFSFCPLAHGMDRRNISATFGDGGRVALFEGSMANIMEHIQTIEPSIFIAIPRFWNKLHNAFETDVITATEGKTEEEKKRIRNDILEKYGHCLGKRVRQIVTGGAPTAPDVFEFMQVCFHEAVISDGYGATEVGGITHNQRIVPDKGTEIRLEDVPDMGYFQTDKPFPRGEICVKKTHMMSEYYNNPDATSSAFTPDGFFRTGDIGEQIEKDKYNIIARKKHIFKLAQGEFVAPESLENSYQSCPAVDQIFVYGDTLKEYLLAVVVPNKNETLDWYNSNSLHPKSISYKEICELDETKSYLLRKLYAHGLSKSLVSYEFIRGILIEPEPFTLENNRLTGPFKVNRNGCENFYKERLDGLYKQIEEAGGSEEQMREHLSDIVKETVTKLASDVLGNVVQENSNLLQFGLDSMSALKLSTQIQETLGTKINVSNLLSAKGNLGDLVTAISTLTELSEEVDWDKEATLPEEIQPLTTANGAIALDCCHLLLTGATGFLGSCLLSTILFKFPNARVTCLVRRNYESTVKILKHHWGEEQYEMLWDDSRINLMTCNLSQTTLGLFQEQWEHLANEIDFVLHCGAHVNNVLPYSALKDVNVSATMELLKLCTFGKPKAFHFVSTAGTLHGILPPDAEKPLPSLHPMINQIGGYSQTKWVSERLVTQAHERGLRATISRPSRISPHSLTAYWNPSDFMLLVLQGIIQMRLYPESPQVHWNLSSVDFVSECIVEIIKENLDTKDSEMLSVFNINYPHNTVSMNTLMVWTKEFGFSVFPIDYSDWKRRLGNVDSANPLFPLREFFQKLSQFPHSPSPSCKKLYALLERVNISPRGLDNAIFHQMLKQMVDQGLITFPN